jgi:hypothetical protein
MNEDWSPTLGGDRASEPPPPVPPEDPPRGAPRQDAEVGPDLPFDLAAFAALLGVEGSVTSTGDPAALLGAIESIGRDFEGFMASAATIFEQGLPPTFAAFEGLVEAVETALEHFTGEDLPPPPSQDR